MTLTKLCAEKWGSVAAAERAIDLGGGTITRMENNGRTATRTLRKILDALDPTDAQRRAILAQFGLVPAVVNAGAVGAGDLAWPGPWFMHHLGNWRRDWVDDDGGDTAVDSRVWLPCDDPDKEYGWLVAALGEPVQTAAQARAADAILATICAGEDPHPYPAELLATDGGES